MKTIAIASPGENECTLWCVPSYNDTVNLDFHVINGEWSGTFYPVGFLKVHATGEILPAKIVWEGDVPKKYSYRDYNEAIHWINTQIKENSGGNHAHA